MAANGRQVGRVGDKKPQSVDKVAAQQLESVPLSCVNFFLSFALSCVRAPNKHSQLNTVALLLNWKRVIKFARSRNELVAEQAQLFASHGAC